MCLFVCKFAQRKTEGLYSIYIIFFNVCTVKFHKAQQLHCRLISWRRRRRTDAEWNVCADWNKKPREKKRAEKWCINSPPSIDAIKLYFMIVYALLKARTQNARRPLNRIRTDCFECWRWCQWKYCFFSVPFLSFLFIFCWRVSFNDFGRPKNLVRIRIDKFTS